MVSHLIEQQCVIIWWSRSNLTIFGSFWRSSQGPHVLFELERFQFFSLYLGSKVCTKEGSFQGVEGKRLKVIQSIFLSLSPFMFMHYLFAFQFLSQSSFSLCVFLYVFVWFSFQFLLYLFFIIYIYIYICEKSKKYKKQYVFVYIGTYVPWMAIETKFSKLCIFVTQMSISMHN